MIVHAARGVGAPETYGPMSREAAERLVLALALTGRYKMITLIDDPSPAEHPATFAGKANL